MDIKRRQFMVGTAAIAAGLGIDREIFAAELGQAVPRDTGAQGERNKQLLQAQRAATQLNVLPSAIPGEEDRFDRSSPLSGFSPKVLWVSNDSPRLPSMTAEQLELMRNGFPAQALGPTFLSYGPMMAEGDIVVEEWESQIYGGNDTLYNNQYLSVHRFKNDELVEFREYNDTQHAAIIFGPPGQWPELEPATTPRRRGRMGVPDVPADHLETAFTVVDKFELNPAMLADVSPTDGPAPVSVGTGTEGNKALILALRQARKKGDRAMVNRLHSKGFRHWISGEFPFGWDHIPLADIYAPLGAHLASPLTVRYGPVIADGDRVFEEMDSFARLDDGTVYNNWHAFVHEIRNGKIVQTREYHDPRHVWATLGRWADWGKTPVPPRSVPRRSNLQGIAWTSQIPTQGGPELERWQPFDPVS